MTIFEKVAKLDTFYAHSNWSVKCHCTTSSSFRPGCKYFWMVSHEEYIFPRPRKVSPRNGTEVKTCFICRGKVSFSAVVEKKDSCLTERSSCLTDRSSCLPERSEGRQRREVRQRSEVRQSFWAETKEKETFSRQRKWSDRTVSIPGILTFIAGGYIFFR